MRFLILLIPDLCRLSYFYWICDKNMIIKVAVLDTTYYSSGCVKLLIWRIAVNNNVIPSNNGLWWFLELTVRTHRSDCSKEPSDLSILNKNENATLQYFTFYEKVLDKAYLLKLNNDSQTSSKWFVETSSICLFWCLHELCSFLCFKRYSLNFAIAHAQKKIVTLICGWQDHYRAQTPNPNLWSDPSSWSRILV